MVKVKAIPPPGVEALAATPNPGTTVWVPMWNLAGGSSNAYKGDWAAGTYYPGDHVVYNGILYECVRQTTAAPVPWPPASGGASYGTTLPSNPVDGQEAVLVDSVTNPTYQWRFRYNAGSTSAYKWEFVGGSGVVAEYSTPPQTISPAGAWTTVPQPSFTIPRAGEYAMSLSALITIPAAGSTNIAIDGGGEDAARVAGFQTAVGDFSLSRTEYIRTWVASKVLQVGLYSSQANTQISRIEMCVRPKRVS